MNNDMLQPALPWWRVPAAWLVVGGPAVVVVASLATLVIALRSADTPLNEMGPRGARSAAVVTAPADALAPATQARNHAASPRR